MDSSFYQARLKKIRERREVSIAIRRGDTSLAAQNMRVEFVGSRASQLQSDAARNATQPVFILGEPDMDIQKDDRFNIDGKLIIVLFVQLNRIAATIAEGMVEE